MYLNKIELTLFLLCIFYLNNLIFREKLRRNEEKMLNTISSRLTTPQAELKQVKQTALNLAANFNTGNPQCDMVCFSGSKEKRAMREAEAKKLQIPEKYDIPLKEVTYHHINAVKAGLDPRTAETHQVKAVKLGLDPMDVTARDVAMEPHKRDLEIDAKLLDVKTAGLSVEELNNAVHQAKLDLHLDVIKEVLGVVPEGYEVKHPGIFDNVLESDTTIEESLQLLADRASFCREDSLQALDRISGGNVKPLTVERKKEIIQQMEEQSIKTDMMRELFRQRKLGFTEDNPTPEKVEKKAKMVWNLKCKAENIKRADFEERLKQL